MASNQGNLEVDASAQSGRQQPDGDHIAPPTYEAATSTTVTSPQSAKADPAPDLGGSPRSSLDEDDFEEMRQHLARAAPDHRRAGPGPEPIPASSGAVPTNPSPPPRDDHGRQTDATPRGFPAPSAPIPAVQAEARDDSPPACPISSARHAVGFRRGRAVAGCNRGRRPGSTTEGSGGGGYTRTAPMSAQRPDSNWESDEKWAEMEGQSGCMCSDSGGCCFSARGGCCFSDRGGCCFSDRGGCCFSDRAGCMCSDNEGCCFANRSSGAVWNHRRNGPHEAG